MNGRISGVAILALVFTLMATPAQAMTSKSRDLQALKAANSVRLTLGRAKTKSNKCLQKYARARLSIIARDGKLKPSDHRSKKSMISVMKKCKLRRLGENLAVGQYSGKDVVDAWMDSAGHRRNILNKKYTSMGVASRYAKGRWWTVQLLGGK